VPFVWLNELEIAPMGVSTQSWWIRPQLIMAQVFAYISATTLARDLIHASINQTQRNAAIQIDVPFISLAELGIVPMGVCTEFWWMRSQVLRGHIMAYKSKTT